MRFFGIPSFEMLNMSNCKWQLGASMVKWTALDPCEGLTMQGSKLFFIFIYFEILFYKILRNILIYKVQ
jgi:hypothetical protein